MITDAELSEALDGLDLADNPTLLSDLRAYESLLRSWSDRVRLVSRNDMPRIMERHILDCLTGVEVLPEVIHTLIDIGTGGGLPGIPLSIVYPETRVRLIDSTRMKTLFLQHVVSELGLSCEVIHNRVESVWEEIGPSADIVTARAVTDFDRLWTYAEPFLKPGGMLVAWKGIGEADEWSPPEGVHVDEHVTRVPVWNRERALVCVTKPS